ncbi:hypothetical protein Tco_0370957 [Tanacetum coccineum]
MAEQDIPPPTITKKSLHQLEKKSAPPTPKTAKQLAAKRNQEREAIKSRFGGNEESKKMQKNVLKHQFENFSTASNETLDKAYDRFQKLISQLEVHGAPISKEDINLPPSWSQIALIMRNKPNIDEIDIDDLYNNLRVYEEEMKRSSSSTSTSQNLAFHSSENTSSTSGDFRVSSAGGISQIDEDDLEELDLDGRYGRNQGKRSYGDNGRSNAPTNESSSQALVAQDGLGVRAGGGRTLKLNRKPSNKTEGNPLVKLSAIHESLRLKEITCFIDETNFVDGDVIKQARAEPNLHDPRLESNCSNLRSG